VLLAKQRQHESGSTVGVDRSGKSVVVFSQGKPHLTFL
jgi:hypothetical protein